MRAVPPSRSPPAFEAETLGPAVGTLPHQANRWFGGAEQQLAGIRGENPRQVIFAPPDLVDHARGPAEPQPAGVQGVVARGNRQRPLRGLRLLYNPAGRG